ncbi:hypothetical protein F0U61_53600 [Archangium violaceum]|uniref:hypothetical protein n=1 Tax=Archangium violaceum TaxID=83451 RepID=UPI002B27CC4F|nr:hypothetical protein F0U61_53600 [Archangium violaceum]
MDEKINSIKIVSRSAVAYLTLLPYLLLGFASSPAPGEQSGMAELLAHAPTLLTALLALPAVARTLRQALLKQPRSSALFELLGYALGKICVAWTWRAIHSAMPTEHAGFIEDFVDLTVGVAMIHGAAAMRALRNRAEAFRRLAAMEACSGSSDSAKTKYAARAKLMHFFVGIVDGALAGMQKRPRW